MKAKGNTEKGAGRINLTGELGGNAGYLVVDTLARIYGDKPREYATRSKARQVADAMNQEYGAHRYDVVRIVPPACKECHAINITDCICDDLNYADTPMCPHGHPVDTVCCTSARLARNATSTAITTARTMVAKATIQAPTTAETARRVTAIVDVLTPLTHAERNAVIVELLRYRSHWFETPAVLDCLSAHLEASK